MAPSTPAPSRFLPSRRQGQGSQAGLTPASALASGPTARRFITTPRFAAAGPSSSSSNQNQPPPRPAFSTPVVAAPGAARRAFSSSARARPPPPSDLIDSSPIGPEHDEEEEPWNLHQHRARKKRSATAEAEDEILPDSPSQSTRFSSQRQQPSDFGEDEEEEEEDDDDDHDQPPVKRRRVSILSDSNADSQPGTPAVEDREDHQSLSPGPNDSDVPDSVLGEDEDEEEEEGGEEELEEGDLISISQSSPHAATESEHMKDESVVEDEDPAESEDDDDEDDDHLAQSSDENWDLKPGRGGMSKGGERNKKPTFHQAPRFKIAEPPPPGDEDVHFPLPEAFSPHRRGTRYVPGGLAAEVRDWLFQVKGAAPAAPATDSSAYDGPGGGGGGTGSSSGGGVVRLLVEDVSASPLMRLVRARRVVPRSRDGAAPGGGETDQGAGAAVKVVLAGEGRISGLGGANGRSNAGVARGSTVVVYPPTWEVVVQGQGNWSMVCDWSVADG